MTIIEFQILRQLNPAQLTPGPVPFETLEQVYLDYRNLYSWERYAETLRYFGFQRISTSRADWQQRMRTGSPQPPHITATELNALRAAARHHEPRSAAPLLHST